MPPNDLFDYLSGRLRQIPEAFALLPVSMYPAPESELSHTGLHVRKVDSSGRPPCLSIGFSSRTVSLFGFYKVRALSVSPPLLLLQVPLLQMGSEPSYRRSAPFLSNPGLAPTCIFINRSPG